MKKAICLTIAVLALLCSCRQVPQQAEKPEPVVQKENPLLGPVFFKPSQEFSFRPPAKWRHKPPIEEITVFQSGHIHGHAFRPNMNVIVEETSIPFKEFVEKQCAALSNLPRFSVLKKGYEPCGNIWRITYDHYNQHYRFTIRCLTQVVLHGKTVYAITFSAPKPGWYQHEGTFLDSLATFKFGEKAKPSSED